MFKNFKEKLHTFLFPEKVEDLKYYKDQRDLYAERNAGLLHKVSQLEKPVPKPTIKDYMREVLGIDSIDFNNVDEKGVPPYFLNLDNKELRKNYVAQLAQIQQLEVWPLLIKYYIDLEGNYIVRNAEHDLAVFCGRMTLNGISLIRNAVKTSSDEYWEGRKPKEDFDEFEVGEGIDINSLMKETNI